MESQDIFENENGSVEDTSVASGSGQAGASKRKLEGPWTMAESVKLVMAMEPHDCLWNPASMSYKIRNCRDAAWADIKLATVAAAAKHSTSLLAIIAIRQNFVHLQTFRQTKTY